MRISETHRKKHTETVITPDGHLLGRCQDQASFSAFSGASEDLLKSPTVATASCAVSVTVPCFAYTGANPAHSDFVQGPAVPRDGKTVGLTECSVTDERGRLIAKATSTCLTLRGEQARDR